VQGLVEFKIFTKLKGLKIPETDPEILRHLHACEFNNEETFKSIDTAKIYLNRTAPFKVSNNVKAMLEQGVVYLSG
jgi:hypothetical protein